MSLTGEQCHADLSAVTRSSSALCGREPGLPHRSCRAISRPARPQPGTTTEAVFMLFMKINWNVTVIVDNALSEPASALSLGIKRRSANQGTDKREDVSMQTRLRKNFFHTVLVLCIVPSLLRVLWWKLMQLHWCYIMQRLAYISHLHYVYKYSEMKSIRRRAAAAAREAWKEMAGIFPLMSQKWSNTLVSY